MVGRGSVNSLELRMLLPMSGNPHPPAGTTLPLIFNPDRRYSWTLNPAAGYPYESTPFQRQFPRKQILLVFRSSNFPFQKISAQFSVVSRTEVISRPFRVFRSFRVLTADPLLSFRGFLTKYLDLILNLYGIRFQSIENVNITIQPVSSHGPVLIITQNVLSDEILGDAATVIIVRLFRIKLKFGFDILADPYHNKTGNKVPDLVH